MYACKRNSSMKINKIKILKATKEKQCPMFSVYNWFKRIDIVLEFWYGLTSVAH